MSGVADLDRLDALLDEIQGIGTSTSPRSEVSNGDNNSNQYSGEEEPQEEDPVQEEEEEPVEIPVVTSKTGTVKKRSGSSASSTSKGVKTKPSSSTASGSKSTKNGTSRSTSGTKKLSSSTGSTSRSTVKKPVAKTKSSSSLAKPVVPNVGDTHVIEVNGQKYDMSTVKIKRAAAPSTLKRTNSNSKPKQSITSSKSGNTVKSKSGTTSKKKQDEIDLDALKREFEDDDLQIYDPNPDKAPIPVRVRKIVREVPDTSPLPKLLLTITFVDGSQKKLYATPDFSVQELFELAADKFDVWQSDLFALYDISDGDDKELDPLNSIKMANLHEKSNIRFKVKWFKVPFRWADPTALYFYYTQLCQNVVSEVYPVNESLAVKLAAIQMQVLLGDYQRSKHHVGFFKEKSIEHFLPSFHVKKMTQVYAEQRIFACYTNMSGLSKEEAMKLYIQTARNIPTFGCTFFKGALDGKVYRRFGVSEEGVWVQQDDDRIFAFYSYRDMKMIIRQPTGLQFKFKSGEFFCKIADAHTKTMLDLISGYNEILVRQLTDGVSRHDFLPKIEFLPEFMQLAPPKPRDEVEVKVSPLGAFKNCYLDECKAKDLKPLHKLLLQVDVAYDADKNLDMLDLSKCDLNDLHLDAIANGMENALKKTSEGIVTLQDMNITTVNLSRNKFGTGRTIGRVITLTKVRVANLKGNNIGNPNCPEGLAAMLKRGNVIEELDISSNNITGPGMEVILEQLKGSETLTKLHIGQNKLEPQFCEFFSKFLKKADRLTVMTLADNKLGEGVKDLMKGLGANRTITELDITNIGITSKTSGLVADWLTSNSTITSFKASYCVLNSSTAERLAKYIEDRYSLLTLHLQDDNLGSSAMKEIVSAMEKNNIMKELMIGGNQIDKKTGLLLGDIIKKNTTLKRLGLRNSGLDASGLVAIGGALEVNDQLEFLDLAGNAKFTKKEVVAQWAGTFQKNVSLTELNLAATGIDKSTVSALFANLKYNNKIETLHLDGNKLSSGVKELAAVLKTSKIKLLTLQNCGLSPKEVIEFLEALGKCTIEVVDVRMNEYIQKNPQLIQQNVDRFNYLTISF